MTNYRVWLYRDGKKFKQLRILAKDRHDAEILALQHGYPIGAPTIYSEDNP